METTELQKALEEIKKLEKYKDDLLKQKRQNTRSNYVNMVKNIHHIIKDDNDIQDIPLSKVDLILQSAMNLNENNNKYSDVTISLDYKTAKYLKEYLKNPNQKRDNKIKDNILTLLNSKIPD